MANYGFDPRTQDYGTYISGGGYVRDKRSGIFLRHLTDDQLKGINKWMIAYNYNVRKIQEYTDQAVTLNKKIDDVQDYATKQGADFTKNNTTTALKHNAPATRTSAVANNDAKRIEKRRRKENASLKRR